jgi:DNA polymerase-4
MGAQRALGRSRKAAGFLDVVVIGLVDRLARRLRAARRTCRTVTLRLRFDDYSRATRSQTLPEATARTQTILATAQGLLRAAMPMIDRRGVTLLGVSLSNLADDDAIQLALPLRRLAPHALDAAVDDIRDRFGAKAITRAALVGREQGPTVPLLPD